MEINLKELKIGGRYTIVNAGGLTPFCANFTLINYYFSNFSQDKNALFLIVKYKRHRNADRIVITNQYTIALLEGWKEISAFNKIKTDENMYELNKININEIPNTVFIHNYGDTFQISSDDKFGGFIDLTGDYIMYNNINHREAEKDSSYIEYIKELLRTKQYNISNLKYYLKQEEYFTLLKSVNVAIYY